MLKINEKFNESSVDDLCAVVRKNTQPSACVDSFCALLHELDDKTFVKSIVGDMNRLIEELMIIFKEVDKLDVKRIKSRILNMEFISVEPFFKKTRFVANCYVDVNDAMNLKNQGTDKITNGYGNKNRLGVLHPKHSRLDYPKVFECVGLTVPTTDSDIEMIRERCRKVVLMWNYLPAIVKAIIQTKRRSLGLDANSKKFN